MKRKFKSMTNASLPDIKAAIQRLSGNPASVGNIEKAYEALDNAKSAIVAALGVPEDAVELEFGLAE